MLKGRPAIYFVLAMALLAFSLYWRSRELTPDVQTIVRQIEGNIRNQFTQLDLDAQRVTQAITSSSEWPSSKFSFVLYDTMRIIQWSNNKAVPEIRALHDEDHLLATNGSSFFLSKSFDVPGKNQHLHGYIPLFERYPIQNQYLAPTLNTDIFSHWEVTVTESELDYPIRIDGAPAFYISVNIAATKKYQFEWIGWFALMLGAILLFMFTWQVVLLWKSNRLNWLGAITVLLSLLAFRLLMVYGNFPGNDRNGQLFNPDVFASSTFNDSIGNFFLNTIAFLISGLITYNLLKSFQPGKWPRLNIGWRVAGVSFFILLCFAFHLLPFLYLETIFHNSGGITVDISQQLYADPVRLVAYGCVVFSSFTGFYFFYAFFKSALGIALRQSGIFIAGLVLAAMGMVVYHILTDRVYEIPILITALHLLILYASTFSKRLKFLASRQFSLYLLALVMFSLQAALAIQLLTQERQRKAMLRYGKSFLVERDILGEYLLSQASGAIARDAFIQQQFSNPFNRQSSITQKIKRSHLNSYFDRYEVRVVLYDSKGQELGAQSQPNLDSVRQALIPVDLIEASPKYFIGRYGNDVAINHYVSIVPVQSTVSGFVVLEALLREVTPVSVFPKLLLDARYSHYTAGVGYSHAIYVNGVLENSAGPFQYRLSNFKLELSNPRLFHDGISSGGFQHVALEDLNGRVAVVSSGSYSFFNLLTNFSFLFLVGLVICFIGLLLAGLPDIRSLVLTYSGQIQLYVYAAMFLPLSVIGGTTLRLNSISERDRSEAENMEKANRLAQNISFQQVQNPDNFQDELISQTRTAGVDASVFSPTGKLLATSQPDIYNNQLVSRLVDPVALQEIKRGNFLFTKDDVVGKLQFRNTYAAVRSPVNGDVTAILSVPYFESQQTIEQNQLRLASNIWTVFAIVFLLFYLLSFVALNWLTKPLQIIAASLRRTTLSGTNRKLTWRSRDEIGTMVNEYNNLIDNLEKSKAELARKQREATWREMARQVAHEIKNPLTPIKLTLQQMEKAFREGTMQPEKNIQSVKTVLHHVDILNEIASSFSAFAQMPELRLERVILQDLIRDTVSLYHNSQKHTIRLNGPGDPIWVMADAKLFVRIFGNIILNAFQSGNDKAVTITIDLAKRIDHVIISFADNGSGMQPEIVDKVFIPYFSTKETGSGLGLAIAKQGIEQAGGRIWCESTVGVGTVFFISLPDAS